MEDKEFEILHKSFLESCNIRKFSDKYTFVNRSKGSKYLLLVLAGYQDYVWDIVFKRISKFVPKNFDVCIVVPGLDSRKLKEICSENNWSYLSLYKNNLSLGLNIAIKLHENAQIIFKNDEDIFLCKNYFEDMLKTNDKYLKDDLYNEFCFLAPCINLNAFSYVNFLQRTKSIDEYEKIFGKARYSFDQIFQNPKAAKFIWDKSLPLDTISEKFSTDNYAYSVCPIRFSIGAIMFTRKIWEVMGYFRVPLSGVLGADESQLMEWGISTSHPIVVSNEILVGHLGYSFQKEFMKEYYLDNIKKFDINCK